MILNFEEYLKEGLWSKGLERAQTGDVRQEEIVSSNIDKLKEVDLLGKSGSFYFADIDLEIEGDYKIKFEQFKEYEKYFKSKGWRLPTRDDFIKNVMEMKFLNVDSDEYYEGKTKVRTLTYENESNGEKIKFLDIPLLHSQYYLMDERENENVLIVWQVGNQSNINELNCVTNGLMKAPHRVRLIKDK